MVARREVDRQVGPCKRLAQEGDRIGRETLLLEEVAARDHRIDPLLLGELDDAGERLAPIPPPQASSLRGRPGERGIQVQVGEMQELHLAASVSEANDSSGVAMSQPAIQEAGTKRPLAAYAERPLAGFQSSAASAAARRR